MSKNQESYSGLLSRWIEAKGLTVAEAAPLLGCSVATAYEHVGGRGLPPSTRIAGLAAVLGVGERRLRSLIERERARRDSAQPVGKG